MVRAEAGLQDSDLTMAEFLEPLGCATAQIGNNHLSSMLELRAS